MPNYDYHCRKCGHNQIDVQLRIADRDVPCHQPCPNCGKKNGVEKMAAAPGVGDAIRQGRTNLPSSWTDKLAEIKSKHRGSTIKIPAPGKREI